MRVINLITFYYNVQNIACKSNSLLVQIFYFFLDLLVYIYMNFTEYNLQIIQSIGINYFSEYVLNVI